MSEKTTTTTEKKDPLDALRTSEIAMKRIEGRVVTAKRKLVEVETELADAKIAHAKLVDDYRKQYCADGVA